MVLKIKDRIQQGTNTAGTGTVSLHVSYSESGFQDFSVLGNGTQTYYTITEAEKWEVGIGTYNTNTLIRDTVLDSSASGARINLNGSGLAFCTYPAAKAIFEDSENNVSVTGLSVGATGIVFDDGSIQTSAYTGLGEEAATKPYVTGVSGYLQTQITSNASDISTNATGISTVSGLTVTNANCCSTNAANIAIVSGMMPDYSWNISDITTTSNISDSETVYVTGKGDIVVDLVGNTLVISGSSGTDPDLSGYATTTYVDTVSGNLQSSINTNTSNISIVSGLTVTNSNDIDTVSGLTVTNANNISANSTNIGTVSGLTVTNASNISTNSTNIGVVSGLTVTNANNISTNSTDIDTVSGIAAGKDNYQYWTITDGSNSENIQSTNTVKFTGEGNTTVSYDTGSNTISISGSSVGGGGGGYDFTVSDGSNSEVVASGDSVTWTGTGATTVSYNTGNNTFTINTPSSEAGYEGWTATDGSVTSEIANGNDVKITGAGNVTVSFASGSPNVFTVSGVDQDLSSYATQAYVTGVSGHLQGQIDTNASNITTVSGLTVTNATNISTNATNIASTGATNAASAATNASNISTNTSNIASTGATNAAAAATNATDISTVSGLTVTNANDINTVSGLLYNSWTASDGSNSEAISGGDEVKFTGTGATTVSYNTGSNTFTINTPSSEAGYEGWTATDGNATSEIANGNDVKITGAGNVTVSFVSGSPNVFTVSGTDQDLSSYATEAYVTGVSGHLQGQIDTNSTNISTNSSNITTVSGLTDTNATNINTVSGLTVTNATDISTVSGLTVTNATDIDTVSGLTVTNASDIDTVSGLLYTSWTVTDGSNSETIAGGDQVKFTGGGNTTVSYNTSNNTVTISGNDVSNTYTAGTGLQLVANEFNVSGIDSSMIVNGSVANADLANSSVTVTAGTGLGNGGAVSLGGSVSVDVTGIDTTLLQGTVTNAQLAGSIANNKLSNDSVTVTAGSGLSNGGEVDLGATITLDITPGGVTNDMLGGSIANDKLSNSSVSYGGVSVSLGASDATPAFNLTDATDYPTSSLVGTITNAQLAGSIDNSKLSNSSVTITAGTGLSNGGAVSLGSSVTIDADTATTSQVGVVQLQDSATDGTTDKAITPNAVYDISGVLQTNIDNAGTTYTAGTGLTLVGSTDFNVSGIDTTLLQGTITNAQLAGSIANAKLANDSVSYGGISLDLGQSDATPAFNLSDATDYPTSSLVGTITNAQLAGSIANAKLVNDSVTVTAGSGLSNGGEVDLGASVTLDITPGGVTAAMLNTDVTLDEITDHGATTTNNITVGMISTSGVTTPISSGSFSATPTFDLSSAGTFTTVMTNNITSMTLSNVTAGQKFILRLVQDGTGSRAATFFNGISWAGGTTPTLTTTAGKADLFGFLCIVSGTYEGFIIGQNI